LSNTVEETSASEPALSRNDVVDRASRKRSRALTVDDRFTLSSTHTTSVSDPIMRCSDPRFLYFQDLRALCWLNSSGSARALRGTRSADLPMRRQRVPLSRTFVMEIRECDLSRRLTRVMRGHGLSRNPSRSP
jgi:hypothetical protein